MESKRDGTNLGLLMLFADVVERHDAEIGVTLLVSGQWVCGLLTSRRRYYDTIVASFTAEPGTVVEAFGLGLGDALEPHIRTLLETDPEARLAGPELYLRLASAWLPDGYRMDPDQMAIRLDRVDAFNLGTPYPLVDDE